MHSAHDDRSSFVSKLLRGHQHFLVQPVSLFNCVNEFQASGFKAFSLCVNGMSRCQWLRVMITRKLV